MFPISKKPLPRISRNRDDSSANYAVEQLEPKILLSAAPIDAPANAYSESPLSSVDSSALEGVRFTDVIEAKISSDFFDGEDQQDAALGSGESFEWGDGESLVDPIVIDKDQRLTGTGETDKDLIINGVFAPGNSPGLVEVDDFDKYLFV